MSFFKKIFSKEKKETLDKGLEKTKSNFFGKLSKAVAGKSKVDDDVLDNLEEVLVSSDVGVDTTLKIIDRIEDTLELTRKNFYSPEMFGKYSLKKIVQAIPTKICYESEDEDAVSDGGDAQLAWFKCTHSGITPEGKTNYKKELLKYCAKDTKAMHDLIFYFLQLK